MSRDSRDYKAFIEGKSLSVPHRGVSDVPTLGSHLFKFQRETVDFGLRAGSFGCFLDTGLGKTLVELEWAAHAAAASNGKALIQTPLAVARQIEREAARFGYQARVVRSADDVREGINICNYDRLHLLDADDFGAVALDEASILKNFTGAVSRELIARFSGHRFRMAATATPAPNDSTELAQHASFLGVMTREEMLVRWFINDSSDTKSWRLKGHAVTPFFDWMASWSRMAEHPRDLGDDVEGFDLAPLEVFRHRAEEPETPITGGLFGGDVSATDIHHVKRLTIESRADVVARLVADEDSEPWLVWCDTDYESKALADRLPMAQEVRGSDSTERKEDVADWFVGRRCLCSTGSTRAKLATWRSAQKATGNDSTKPIAGSDSPNPSPISRNIESADSNTCGPTTEPIEISGRSAQESSGTDTTPSAGLVTPPTSPSGRARDRKSRSGKSPIQASGTLTASENTESPLRTSSASCESSAASAPSVETGALETAETAGSTSTTAIRASEYGGSSVQHATSESASSETTRHFSGGPRCICGHESGRRVLITKPSLFGQGLNFQFCARMVFVGRGFSYEAWYQAVRRCWRFGQKRPVHVHLIVAEGEDAIGRVIDRKADDHAILKSEMKAAMRRAVGRDSARRVGYSPTHVGRLPAWMERTA